MLSCVCDFILLVNSLESSLFCSGCCKSVTLSATGGAAKWPWLLGSYEANGEEHEGSGGEEHEGAPVYWNSHGRKLYKHSDGTWHGDRGLGNLRSVDTAECPASISQWQYSADGDIWHSGDITAQC